MPEKQIPERKTKKELRLSAICGEGKPQYPADIQMVQYTTVILSVYALLVTIAAAIMGYWPWRVSGHGLTIGIVPTLKMSKIMSQEYVT